MEPRQPLDQSGEGAALSAAIQRLIAERDRHKSLAAAQESELVRLKAINEELRRQNEEISLARDRYLGLAAELLTQLQQVDTRDPGRIAEIANCVGERRRGHLGLRAPLLAKAEPGRRHCRLNRTCSVKSVGRAQRDNAAGDEQHAGDARRVCNSR